MENNCACSGDMRIYNNILTSLESARSNLAMLKKKNGLSLSSAHAEVLQAEAEFLAVELSNLSLDMRLKEKGGYKIFSSDEDLEKLLKRRSVKSEPEAEAEVGA